MFNTVFRFEVKQHLKKPFTWIFFSLMLLQGLYYMHHAGEFYSADQTYTNAPAILYTVLAGMGYIGFIVTAILGGNALGKDLDSRTSALLYTTGTSQASFFSGRYVGSLLILLLLYAGYLVGIILYNYLPIPNLGPFSWPALARAMLLIFLPNVLILYSLCFSVAVLTKSSRGAYVAALIGILLMIFSETSFDSNAYMVLGDPTCFSVLHQQLEHLSPVGKNNFSPDFSGLLLYNRLVWISISLVLMFLASVKFSFINFSSAGSRKSRKHIEEQEVPVSLDALQPVHRNAIYTRFSLRSYWIKIFPLSWLEFKSVVRPWGFKLFLALILIIYICYVAVWQQQYFSAAPTLPVTLQVTGVTLPLSFYFLLFLIIYTTELLFRNNTSGFWQIGDALPVPTWVTVLSKILAILGVALLLAVCLTLFGMLVQAAKGYYHFELGVYFNELFIRWIPKYLLYILLTIFVAGLTANRYATHWITILFLFFSVIMHETDAIEQNRLNFMFSPGSGLATDMNGNSIFGPAHAWFMWYWLALTMALLALALWLWQRGTPVSLIHCIRKSKINVVLLIVFVVGIAGFLFCGEKIYQTVNVENKFQMKTEERAEKALYEKTYKRYQDYPQPIIKALSLNLNLFPENRELDYIVDLKMQNESGQSIDTLHVEWMDFSLIDSIAVKGHALTLVKSDSNLRHNVYTFAPGLLPGDSMQCYISGRLSYRGFTNGDPQKELTFNGSFLSHDLIPFFGYDDRRELKSNHYRPQYGLTKLTSRLPDTTDRLAADRLFASTQAERIKEILTISTDPGQTIVAPGILVNEWQSGDWNYFRFLNERPALFDFHILSARYAVKKERVNIAGTSVDIEVYYHPGHPYNIAKFIASAKEALIYLNKVLGTYPYSVLRIAERPHYDEDLYAYGNVIVLPENHGWTADIRRQEDLDYLRYITTRLIAEQYMRQSNVSRTLGYPLVIHSIPGYLALQQLKHFYGEVALQKRLEKNYDIYLKGRAKEENTEPTLIKSDEQADYVFEQKGGYALYRLSQLAGSGPVNRSIRTFLKQAEASGTPVNAELFYRQLKTAVGPSFDDFLRSVFETTAMLKPISSDINTRQ